MESRAPWGSSMLVHGMTIQSKVPLQPCQGPGTGPTLLQGQCSARCQLFLDGCIMRSQEFGCKAARVASGRYGNFVLWSLHPTLLCGQCSVRCHLLLNGCIACGQDLCCSARVAHIWRLVQCLQHSNMAENPQQSSDSGFEGAGPDTNGQRIRQAH